MKRPSASIPPLPTPIQLPVPGSICRMVRLGLGFLLGLGLVLTAACFSSSPPSSSPPSTNPPAQQSGSPINSAETALQVLEQFVLPGVGDRTQVVPDEIALRYTVDSIEAPLPSLEEFPLYGAQPNDDGFYIEIFSSSEKANAERQNERWLVEVADAFNAQNQTLASGEPIRVGVRKIASGAAARLLIAEAENPVGYSPSNDLWVEMVKSQGIGTQTVAPSLVPNTAGWVVPQSVYQALAASGPVTFDQMLNAIASGQIQVAYPNPYTSSTALNLLYTLYWRAAGHQSDGGQLTEAEIASPQVNSVFEQFQSQVLITTPTTLDLQELFLRDQSKLQAFPLEYQNYVALKQLPGFEQTEFIPFGIPHNNPLVGFDWNSPQQQEALQKFADFARSEAMQVLATEQGFESTDHITNQAGPPIPSGDVLLAAQSNWKLRKDGGRTVYMSLVIDTSGSMDGPPLEAVQTGLRIAAQHINPGNYISLVTFDDQATRRLPLALFDEPQHQKLLATVDQLEANGNTAMYDGIMLALADLLKQQQQDPTGRYYLLLLTDGQVSAGNRFNDRYIQDIMAYSGVRFYPIAYGEVDEAELQAIASLRESTVKIGDPDTVQELFQNLFQINL
ncbi:MAG: VWA domain-containing protein [Leptolyngbyaceae cyanobacterium]